MSPSPTYNAPGLGGGAVGRVSDAAPLALGVAAAAGIAAGLIFSNFLVAAAVPFLIASAAFWLRFPSIAVVGAVSAASVIGTITTYASSIPPQGLSDAILIGLWLAVIWLLITQGREHRFVLWPGLLLLVAYVLLTVAALVTADDISAGFESFRLSAWYILIVPLLALAPWGPATFRRMARGILLVTVVVGLYCLFRYAVGSSTDEILSARATQPSLPRSLPLRFFGTQLSAQELAGWAAVILPFAIAMVLGWRGRWRFVAIASAGLLAFALLAADVRTGVAAAAAGIAVTLLVFLVARAYPSSTRVATAFATFLALIVVGTVGYVTTVGSNPETADRLSALLHPNEDQSYQIRSARWDAAWDEIEAEPWGHGMGTTGAVAQRSGQLPVGPIPLDNSYLKVGLEQGLAVMIFYAAAMLAVVLGLAYRAATTTDPFRAALAMGAAGTLTAMMVLFYGSLYAELPAVVIPGWVIVGLGCAGFTTYRFAGRRGKQA